MEVFFSILIKNIHLFCISFQRVTVAAYTSNGKYSIWRIESSMQDGYFVAEHLELCNTEIFGVKCHQTKFNPTRTIFRQSE